MNKLQGFAEAGNTTLVITGAAGTITRKVQGNYPSATITIYNAGTLDLSTIYSDDGSPPTAKANPFTSSADGSWSAYLTPGRYDVKFSGGGISAPFTLGDFPVGIGAGGVPSYAFASLPISKTQNAGNLARVTDSIRGLWMDSGSKWFQITGDKFYAGELIRADGVTDDTANMQTVITAAAGREIILPSGTIVITSTLTYNTNGNSPGLRMLGAGNNKTFFDNRVANGAMLSLDGSQTLSTYAFGSYLSDFAIITTTSPISSRGIDIRSQWFMTIERVRIVGLTSDAIRLTNNNGDPDGTVFMTLNQVDLRQNGGWGFRTMTPPLTGGADQNASGQFLIKNSYIILNTGGGVWAIGLGWKLLNVSIYNNTGVGLFVPYNVNITAQTTQQVIVENCEFDGNGTFHIDLGAVIGAKLIGNKFISAGTPAALVRVGDGGAGQATAVEIERSLVRRDAGSITAFSFGSNSLYSKVTDTFWQTTTGVTKFVDAGTGNSFRDDGQYRRRAISTSTISTTTSYTPDTLTSTYHRVVITATGAFTFNAPVGPFGGRELTLRIINSSGGVIAVAFNAVYSVVGYIDPPNGGSAVAHFIYDPDSALWVQDGAWANSANSALYSPTVTAVTNISGTPTGVGFSYIRDGAFVDVDGMITCDPTGAGACEVGISLPFASNFANNEECLGAFDTVSATDHGVILADTVNDRARMLWTAVDTADRQRTVRFRYRII